MTARDQSGFTNAQRLVWLGQRLNPGAPHYNMALRFSMPKALSIDQLNQAWAVLTAECEVLRLGLRDIPDSPSLVEVAPAKMEVHDELTDEEQTRLWDAAIQTRFLPESTLTRSLLTRVRGGDWQWLLVQHHLVTDLASFFIIHQRLAAIYQEDACSGKIEAFDGYAEREAQVRDTAAVIDARDAIVREVQGTEPALGFYGRVATVQSTANSRYVVDFESTGKRRDPTKLFGQDLNDYFDFLAALAIVLWRAGECKRLVIGVPLHNRTNPRRKNTAGMLVEIAPLVLDLTSGDSLRHVRDLVATSFASLMKSGTTGLVDESLARSFDVVLNYLQVPELHFAGHAVESEWLHCDAADPGHALRLHIWRESDDAKSRLLFDCRDDTFTPDRVDAFRDQLFEALAHIESAPERTLDKTALIGERRCAEIATRSRGPIVTRAWSGGVVQMIRDAANKKPEAASVWDENRTVKFSELIQLVECRAASFVAAGVTPDSFVLVWRARSIDTVVDILAVMWTGACFVPVEASTPEGRVREIVADLSQGDANVFSIVDSELNEAARLFGCRTLPLSESNDVAPIASDVQFQPIEPESRCYVLYTSGSTGRPKGVAVSHRSIDDYVRWAWDTYGVDDKDRFGLFTSIGFDLTLTSLLLPLVCGASLRVFPVSQSAADVAVADVVSDSALTFAKLTPSHLAFWSTKDLERSAIRCWVIGGEQLTVEQADRIARSMPDTKIYNEYGPTEATVACMVHRYTARDRDNKAVPIGLPAANHTIYVLDRFGHPVLDETVGEIYIGGAGVALGYLNKPEETIERFVRLPGVDDAVYRTGDLARWNAHGQLEYLGRADSQVKISGVRLELSEIDNLLLSHPGISAAATILRSSDQTVEPRLHCIRCGLPDNYPEVTFSDDGVCSVCIRFEDVRDEVMQWFGTTSDLEVLIDDIKTRGSDGSPDCAVLFSGGKDSTYMVYQLVKLGLKPVALSLDNGFISDGAHENIRRVVQDLGIRHEYLRTEHMNRIFADSLDRFSNVCNGCFKTIYSLSMQYADREGIGTVFTGLSRGQLFETRLDDLFSRPEIPVARYDEMIDQARKAYHRMDDVAGRCLGNGYFDSDDCFDRVRFIDFYRYVDVGLDEVYAFLDTAAPWVRPADTGRSTNCLINDSGIYVHRQEQGYHNYALPYAWDVRMGHKTRDQAIDELRDRIDPRDVTEILKEVGYTRGLASSRQLTSWVVTQGTNVSENAVMDWLREHLPANVMPRKIHFSDALPLTANGKVDIAALEQSNKSASLAVPEPPHPGNEALLAQCWQRAFGRSVAVNRHDDFFAIGGDSMAAILLVDEIRQQGHNLGMDVVFEHPVLSEMAMHLSGIQLADDDSVDFGLDLEPAALESLLKRNSGQTQ